MSKLTRRDFIKLAGATSGLGMIGISPLVLAAEKAKAEAAKTEPGKTASKVVVIGGGYGGAIAAKYMRMLDPAVEVTLIDKEKEYVSCPLSNEVLSGHRDLKSLSFTYDTAAKKYGYKTVFDEVVEIDAGKKTVKTKGGTKLQYDKLVVSPGVEFNFKAIEGYDEKATEKLPHAWKAGPQTLLLRKQIEAMKDGGRVIIVAPPNPYRCPPGPYERAAQIAIYLKEKKPKSKILILDPKDKFSKQGLFEAGWKHYYGDMIEWVGGAAGGKVDFIDVAQMTVQAEIEKYKGDVINVIPAQMAGAIARAAGLADDKGWCPVDQRTFESTLHKDVHVIGDSCIAGAMPKSGYAANSQGKVAAGAIIAALSGRPSPAPSYVNTCYSLIAPDYGISVAGVYELKDGKIVDVPNSGGVSPAVAHPRVRQMEAEYALSWFKNITSDMFG